MSAASRLARSQIIRWIVSKFGTPRGQIGARVNLKRPGLIRDFVTGHVTKADRRNRRIVKTYRFDDKEVTYHATKGWRVVKAAT